MNNIFIKVENPGKKYLIKHEQKEPGISHSRTVGGVSLNPFQKNTKKNDDSIEEFWALNNVSFEINQR